ncbi:MAG: translation initiation factor IF-5A, partial [archaeon]|nr:translation initiation factor IF-5A [archaeon]
MPGTDRVEIRTLKVGRFCVVEDEAYKILSISKSKPGKHGSAKARLELINIFNDKKISHVGTVTDTINVPMIEKGTASTTEFTYLL